MSLVPEKTGIKQFDGSNYESWRYRLLILLKKECVDSVVTGGLPALRNQTQEWQRSNATAISIIVSHLSDSMLDIVKTKSAACQMLEALDNNFKFSSDTKLVDLRDQLYSMKYKMGENVRDYVLKFRAVVNELKSVGDSTSVRQHIIKLLKSLPPEYFYLRIQIESIKDQELSWDKLTNQIADVAESLCGNKSSVEKAAATPENDQQPKVVMGVSRNCHRCGKPGHIARYCRSGKSYYRLYTGVNNSCNMRDGKMSEVNGNNWRDRNYGDKRNVRCNFCGILGHVYKDCRKRVGNSNGSRSNSFSGNKNGSFNNGSSVSNHNDRNQNKGGNVNSAMCGNTESASGDKPVAFNVDNLESVMNVETSNTIVFKVDSACNDHLINRDDVFCNYVLLKEPVLFRAANCGVIKATKIGNMKCRIGNRDAFIKNVYYADGLNQNLLSVAAMADHGYRVVFDSESADIIDSDNCAVARAVRKGQLYELKVEPTLDEENCVFSTNQNNDTLLWHRRLGHLNFRDLRYLSNSGLISGVSANQAQELCESCIYGKQHRLPFYKNDKRATKPLELVHSDVVGPITPVSHDNKSYFVTFLDDYTHFCYVYPIASKAEVFEKFKEYHALVTNRFSCEMKALRTDNGGEYINENMISFTRDRGINYQHSVAYRPQMNGRAERLNRTLVERARTALLESGLSSTYWTEALYYAAYSVNRSPTVDNKIPAELWLGKPVNFRLLKPFGCTAYVLKNKFDSKFDSKSEKLVFVGYSPGSYRVLDTKSGKVSLSRDVVFDEHVTNLNKDSDFRLVDLENIEDVPVVGCVFDVQKVLDDVPKDVESAKRSKSWSNWRSAMEDEIASINSQDVFSFVPRPVNKPVISCRWVFRKKNDVTFKARLVARGFQQADDIKNVDLYAPVAKLSTFRTLLAVASQRGYYIEQADVKSAYLYGVLNDEVYMELPDGIDFGFNARNTVIKLKKALYGLRQAPKVWNEHLHLFLSELNFQRCLGDPCLYIYVYDDEVIYLLIFVDDFVIVGNDKSLLERFKEKMCSRFQMSNYSVIKDFLGIRINYNRDERVVTLDQTELINKVCKRFRVTETNVLTPMENRLSLSPIESSDELTKLPYKQLLGCLMFIMLGTRPDICYAISYLSRFQDKCSDIHFKHLMRVLKYLRTTVNFKLRYCTVNSSPIVGYADADFASDSDRKSTSGYCFKVFNCLVSWSSKKQSIVCLSTVEAEYVALSECVAEFLWLKKILDTLSVNVKSVVIYEDNVNCINMAKDVRNTSRRTKHVDIKYHFVKESVENNVVNLKYVPSCNQEADVFTKALPRQLHEKFCTLLNLK